LRSVCRTEPYNCNLWREDELAIAQVRKVTDCVLGNVEDESKGESFEILEEGEGSGFLKRNVETLSVRFDRFSNSSTTSVSSYAESGSHRNRS